MEGDLMEKSKDKEIKWYDSGHMINNLIIVVILLTIIFSQAFAVSSSGSLSLFGSVINHNSIYLLALIYFIFLKFNFGKKYFNYFNVFLVFVYFIATITSLLTVIQSFTLSTVLSFTINFVLVVYMIHTFFRDTRYWNELRLYNSPFNEFSNDSYFYAVIVVTVFLLMVNLISTVALSGVIISILDALYFILLGRFIYLDRQYLDKRKKNIKSIGNFDEIRDTIKSTIDDASDKVKDFIEENNIDEKIDDLKDNVSDASKNIKNKIVEVSKSEEVNNIKDNISDASKNIDESFTNFVKNKRNDKNKRTYYNRNNKKNKNNYNNDFKKKEDNK
jgi:hypothetical protein